jgi:hypothetical protein
VKSKITRATPARPISRWRRICFALARLGNGQGNMKDSAAATVGARAAASPREVEVMASVLEGRHGVLAVEIAEFLAAVHEEAGDGARAGSWYEVSLAIRRRESARLAGGRH